MSSSLYSSELMRHHQEPTGWCEDIYFPNQMTIQNAFCGDELIIGAALSDDQRIRLQFTGECCAVCRASASIMCEALENIALSSVDDVVVQVRDGLKGVNTLPEALSALSSIQHFPVRKQCAELPWKGLSRMIDTVLNNETCESHSSNSNDSLKKSLCQLSQSSTRHLSIEKEASS